MHSYRQERCVLASSGLRVLSNITCVHEVWCQAGTEAAWPLCRGGQAPIRPVQQRPFGGNAKHEALRVAPYLPWMTSSGKFLLLLWKSQVPVTINSDIPAASHLLH